jgi:hypothetical protein
MRFILVAVVLGLVGCVSGGTDPGSVVAGLTQQEVDQTDWLFNPATSDLVAAGDLAGPAEDYEPARVRIFAEGIVVYLPAVVGESPDVLLDGQTRPNGGNDNDGVEDGGAAGAASRGAAGDAGMSERGGFWNVTGDGDFTINRFDDGLLNAMLALVAASTARSTSPKLTRAISTPIPALEANAETVQNAVHMRPVDASDVPHRPPEGIRRLACPGSRVEERAANDTRRRAPAPLAGTSGPPGRTARRAG